MSAELQVSTDFYILDQEFNKVFALTQYESLMWVDKYDEPGTIQIYAPPTDDIKKYAVIGNYIQSSRSEHIMVIEKLITTYSSEDGERLTIEGRSLESILDRRVIFLGLYLTNKKSLSDEEGANNLEDAIKRLLDHTFIDPENEDRAVTNFIFEYSDDDQISDIEVDNMEFEKGENVLNIVNTIVKSKGLGYKITLNSQKQLVFKLIKGVNRTIESGNPLVEFSPMFNNIKDTTYTVDGGENYKNYIYTEGEIYNGAKPKIIETGDTTGLARREHYIVSDSTHEKEATIVTHEEGIVKESTVLSNEDYEKVLQEEGEKSYKSFSLRKTMESEVEPRLQFVYGRDFFIGDILQIKDKSGNTGYSRCVEFIISHSASGYEEYPTFEDVNEEQETPSQTTASGGEYSDEGKKTSDEIIAEAVAKALQYVPSHIGQVIESTRLSTLADVKAIYGPETNWIQHSGYMLRGATSGVVANQVSNDGGADSVTVSSVASHNHSQNAHGHGLNLGNNNTSIPNVLGPVISSPQRGNYYPAATNWGATDSNMGFTTIANATAGNNANGSNYTVNTLPKYKNVYIWERTA